MFYYMKIQILLSTFSEMLHIITLQICMPLPCYEWKWSTSDIAFMQLYAIEFTYVSLIYVIQNV